MFRKFHLVAVWVGIALVTSGCLPSGFRLPQSDLLGAVERKSGLIAYLGVDGNVYVADQSGSSPTQVTTDADFEGQSYRLYDVPTWSPDSQSLAFSGFTAQAETQVLDSAGLYVAQKDGTGLTQLYTSDTSVIYYDWAPNSQHVTFLSNTGGAGLALRRVAASGGEAELLDAGQPFYWNWSPDSQSMLVHVGDVGGRLSVLHFGDGVTEDGLKIEPTNFRSPAYSPDGKQMLVAGQNESGHPALLLADINGQNARVITEYEGLIAFAWSPNGKRIAYTIGDLSQDGGLAGHLTVVDPTGKGKPVELDDTQVYAFFWSPDSKSLAYFALHELPAPTPVPDSSASEDTGPQSVWGLSVMDAQKGATHEVLVPLYPPDKFLQYLPYFDQYHRSVTLWSPDSQNLVVTSYYANDAPPGIFVVTASGNLEPRRIADGWGAFWSWK